ncbi:MAG: copper amine oxidase N-terminal domain-containing protein [Paenibacillus sp.]|nr:copper amine oxidase N-terminal domain-containing protein [Paenibacillus sp.]
MKKSFMILVSCILAVSLTSGAALAKSPNGNGEGKKQGATATKSVTAPAKTNEKVVKDKATVTSVTYATYGNNGHNGYKGLLKAIENVKDKPSGAVIAELLLTKYNTQLTPEMKAQLEAIVEKDAALSALADILAKKGSVTDAVYVQKEAILANVTNLDSYKKLGVLYEKTGKKGVKLFVNGEESASAVAPILTTGTTLVPFRAISESLQAEVVWNQKERSVTVTRDGTTVKLFIDKKTAYVNGQPVTLQVPAAIVKGNTVVPVRFVSEALKATVKWEAESQTVVIYEE